MRVLLILLLGFCALPLQAGPWLRDKGETFLSVSLEGDLLSGGDFVGIYTEYGWSDTMTLGLDLGGHSGAMSKAIVFARRHFGTAPGGMRLAVELGAGLADDDPVLRPALSFGRGLDWKGRNGWLVLDARALIIGEGREIAWEGDLTFGMQAFRKSRAILQLQARQPVSGDAQFKLAQSWVIERAPGRHLEVGVTTGIRNSDALALKLALWHNF